MLSNPNGLAWVASQIMCVLRWSFISWSMRVVLHKLKFVLAGQPSVLLSPLQSIVHPSTSPQSSAKSHLNVQPSWANSRRFFTFLRIFGHFMALFGVRRGFKMILSHRALTSLNMSSYRAIWTHFRPNFIFFGPKNLRLPKIQTFPKMQISTSSHSHKHLTYMGR